MSNTGPLRGPGHEQQQPRSENNTQQQPSSITSGTCTPRPSLPVPLHYGFSSESLVAITHDLFDSHQLVLNFFRDTSKDGVLLGVHPPAPQSNNVWGNTINNDAPPVDNNEPAQTSNVSSNAIHNTSVALGNNNDTLQGGGANGPPGNMEHCGCDICADCAVCEVCEHVIGKNINDYLFDRYDINHHHIIIGKKLGTDINVFAQLVVARFRLGGIKVVCARGDEQSWDNIQLDARFRNHSEDVVAKLLLSWLEFNTLVALPPFNLANIRETVDRYLHEHTSWVPKLIESNTEMVAILEAAQANGDHAAVLREACADGVPSQDARVQRLARVLQTGATIRLRLGLQRPGLVRIMLQLKAVLRE